MDTESVLRPLSKWNCVVHDGRRLPELRALACGLPAVLDRRVRFEPHPSLPNFAQMSGARSG